MSKLRQRGTCQSCSIRLLLLSCCSMTSKVCALATGAEPLCVASSASTSELLQRCSLQWQWQCDHVFSVPMQAAGLQVHSQHGRLGSVSWAAALLVMSHA